MASVAVKVTVGTTDYGGGQYSVLTARSADPVAARTTAVASTTTADNDAGTASGTLTTNVAAAVAALVADGATPTQGHVTTLNTAWGLLATAIATAKTSTATAKTDTAAVTVAGSVLVIIDTSVVTNMNQLRNAFAAAMKNIEGSGTLTP